METHCSWFVKLKLSLYYRLSLLFSLFLFCLPAIGQLPILCQANQLAIQQTPNEIQETLRTSLKIELKNKHNIILDQNVPNPFDESTALTFFIPVSVL